MNHCSHPRLLHVLRRTRRSLASTGRNPSAHGRSSHRPTPLCDAAQLRIDFGPPDNALHPDFTKPLHTIGPIQNT
jgi:hypothetical protein